MDPVSVLGTRVAKRVEPFGDGRRYVRAGIDLQVDLGNGASALGLLGLPFVVPLVYGLFYSNGRALGAVLTGTQLVRLKDGGRVGFWAPWAMLVRILLPLLLVAAGGPPWSVGQVSR